MNLIHSVILYLFFKARSCQLQCVKANKVTVPYRKIWFRGDPQNTISIEVVHKVESRTKDTLTIDGLPRGEYEYGFKLEWECNQTYIFPKRVRISVSELIQKPNVWVPLMVEGRAAILQCVTFPFCSEQPKIHWNWTKTGGQSMSHGYDYEDYDEEEWHARSTLYLTPVADDHNTNVTCVADYGHTVVETTVTLTVIFSPKILHSSQCMIEGKLLVCACISWGNPLPPITWPLASLTDFSVNSFSSIQTVTSTFTMPAADYHNTSVKCISSNELGQAEIDIPLQNNTENSRLNNGLDLNHKSDAVLPWIITGVSLILNLALLTGLIICTYKRCRGESKQKEVCEEMNTYASLNRAHVEQDYGVISPQTRGVHRERPGVVRATPDNWPPRVPPHNPK